MKTLNITLTDEEHKKLQKIKERKDLTWRELLLEKIEDA